MSGADESSTHLVELGRLLQRRRYDFTAVTPETHRRNNSRAARAGSHRGRNLRDVLGWSRVFEQSAIPGEVFSLLERAGAVGKSGGGLWKSTVRYASLGNHLFVHSAYPTVEDDSVFFGPDTYRFVDFVTRNLTADALANARLVDIGCGSGVGGIMVGSLFANAHVMLADVNVRALQYASINCRIAALDRCECIRSDVLAAIDGQVDIVISNPPYMLDAAERVYRNGGGGWGSELSLRILRESLPRLKPGGRLLMYTGAAVVDGNDVFLGRALPILKSAGVRYSYQELDPDVFGEELDQSAYCEVERIAAVGLAAYADTST